MLLIIGNEENYEKNTKNCLKFRNFFALRKSLKARYMWGRSGNLRASHFLQIFQKAENIHNIIQFKCFFLKEIMWKFFHQYFWVLGG